MLPRFEVSYIVGLVVVLVGLVVVLVILIGLVVVLVGVVADLAVLEEGLRHNPTLFCLSATPILTFVLPNLMISNVIYRQATQHKEFGQCYLS